ncbi:hypothetical protein EIO_1993 [Ketogulonicigenium vulgare Y25]|uniref:hypothetical protein n=1 Tax=Ketogulonicigenium vulgare TaxID=92945 RepID=UPI0001E670E9|nr:hypothetical protein [Ketogulonicigenium vulgare]ADO43102.1 hypothetical protein EIO_1993 [Ketogulonicigenium vulgare Y25]
MLALGFGLTALAALAGARAGAVPVISLASSSGYAGAELVSSVEGQWYADGVAIPGAWGGALMITPDLEGAAIFLRVDPHIWVSDGDPGYAGSSYQSSVFGQWLRVDPHIWVSDGDPGYAGSSYQSSVFGQWQADGVDIPGAVGLRWQMTPAYEGAAISLDYRPIIRIVQGAGYAGSRLRSNLPGQWFADGVAIPGSIGRDLIISPALEGAAISQDADITIMQSNTIQMWVPERQLTAPQKDNGGLWLPALEGAAISQDADITIMQSNTIQMWVPERQLTAPQKDNGGLWLGEDRTTVERNGADYVTAWRDKFGVRDYTQPTAANQPRAGTFRGMPAVIWDKSPEYQYLQPPAAFAPMWWLVLAEFATGVEIISGTSTGSAIYTQILGNGQAALARVSFQQPDAVQSGTSAIRLNAAAPSPAARWTGRGPRRGGGG